MKKGTVLYKNYITGTITETDDGEYIFQYDEKYVNEHPDKFISFSMSVRKESYHEPKLDY
nr:HipA N-terminal domain-containing protein [uncultured Draconibacterium sp.]